MSKELRRKVEAVILPPLFYLFAWGIYLTCKRKFHLDEDKKVDKSIIVAVWHGELMFIPFAYRHYRKKINADSIISQHHDGELVSRVIKFFGGGVIRGSSSKGGVQVLKKAIKAIRSGKDIGITPDGPRGPRHSVANGVVVLAQKMKVPVIAVNIKASKAWRMKSWDRFSVPKPFSQLDFYYSEPFYLHEVDFETAKETIKERLMRHAF